MIGPEDSISNFGGSAAATVSAAAPPPSNVSAASRASLVSALGAEPRCFLAGCRLPSAEGGLVAVEELSVDDRLRAATGEEVQVVLLRLHQGEQDVVTLHVGDASLSVTASHRLQVSRGGQLVSAPAQALQQGHEVLCRSGVHPVTLYRRETIMVNAYEIQFVPDLPLETFPADTLLTQGRAPRRGRNLRRRRRDASPDAMSVPSTDDGY